MGETLSYLEKDSNFLKQFWVGKSYLKECMTINDLVIDMVNA